MAGFFIPEIRILARLRAGPDNRCRVQMKKAGITRLFQNLTAMHDSPQGMMLFRNQIDRRSLAALIDFQFELKLVPFFQPAHTGALHG